MNILVFLIFLGVVEVGFILVVTLQRRSFPWLITMKDEFPQFDEQALNFFLDSSFDENLGWVRKPNSSGIEKGKNGPITFHIDSAGSRTNSFETAAPIMAAFGDSYVFCRQVEDDETWEAQLSRKDGFGVLNFGVGNYGVDQGLLRYEQMTLPDSVRFVVMGFVPETICRIQSYWKHYLEFGNTFAFKPRFIVDSKGELILLQNRVRSADDFAAYKEKLPEIREADGFYEKKFRSQQFRFPYTFSFMRNPLKNSLLIISVAIRAFCRLSGFSIQKIENLPFTFVMKNNLRDAHQQYEAETATTLLKTILVRFKNEAERQGHIPLIVVTPQLLDLKLTENKIAPFQSYFSELAQQLPVIDMTAKFVDSDFENLYINDQYGGHLSVEGNRLVAEEISSWLKVNHGSAI
jgi:hypothetical protein